MEEKYILEEMPKWLQKIFWWCYRRAIKTTLENVKNVANLTKEVYNLKNSKEWIDFQDELNKISV